jgi:isopentenyl diphosphate isomerase/L-lactate dehydrogenase-like FMN-dependent dehydrogenase
MKPREIASLVRLDLRDRDPVCRRLRRSFTIEDVRAIARRRLPRAAFDFVESGADDELTVQWNREAFDSLQLMPRVLRDVSTVDTSVSVLGETLRLPLILGPAGVVRFVHPQLGEAAVAAGAAAAGIPYVLPTMSTTSIERVAEVEGARLWFNLLLWRDRGISAQAIARAAEAGYRVLVVTVDVPVSGSRPREKRLGVTMPPRLRASTIAEAMLHPGWWSAFLRGEPFRYPNVSNDIAKPLTAVERVDGNFDASATWSDVEWIRERWHGPILIKGILTPDDARRAVDAGVEGIVVSNHGGRQIDHLPPSIEVLSDVVDAAAGELEIFLDSGIRRGSDIVKAVALGARACFVARPYFYGLAAGGQRGVEHVISIFQDELVRTMKLVGVTTLAELDPGYVRWRPGRSPISPSEHAPYSG